MSHYEQTLMSCTPGGTTADSDIIRYGDMDLINRAVTLDGNPQDLANPKVKLVSSGGHILGAIVGYANNKIQVAVTGWDITFINSSNARLNLLGRIVGGVVSGVNGYVKNAPNAPGSYSQTMVRNKLRGRGSVIDPGKNGVPGNLKVKVALMFGH